MHVLGGAVRILVADDQEPVRKRICGALSSRADLEVCAEASNGQEAVEMTRALNPDLVILDITMPLLNGLEAARQIREFAPDTPIVILSVHRSRQLVETARNIGVRGYVTKAEAVPKLLQAVDRVRQNETFFPDEL
jgi:two-component system, NarL family, nitrate/nitrite response regulator NarL